MKVIIYSKENCPNCVKAKALMDKYNPTILKIGENISRDKFFDKFPNAKTVPQIEIDGKHIGGYRELVEWVNYNDEQQF